MRPLLASYEDKVRRIDGITALEKSGFALEVQGQNAQSIAIYKESLTAARKELGDNTPRTTLIYVDLARVTAAQGNFAESQKLYEQALADLKKNGIDWQLERVLQGYGDMLNRSGQKQHAASVYAEAKQIWSKNRR